MFWCLSYPSGLRYHEHFRGPVILTHDNFQTHIQYCITFYYYICHIDKYTYVEVLHVNNFGRFGICFFEQERFCSTQPKCWESLCIFLYVQLIWCSGVPEIYCQLEVGGMSAWGICAFFYMWNLFSVVDFHRSMVNWRRGNVFTGYMCILLYVKLIQCSGVL